MKKLFVLCMTVIMFFGAFTFAGELKVEAADTPPNPLEKPGWVLTRNDEFNGTTLDESLWIPRYLGFRTSQDRGNADYYFKNGSLVLRVTESMPTYYSSGDAMKVSSIQTAQGDFHQASYTKNHNEPYVSKFSQKYGYFEIRAKGQADRSGHSAFWFNTDDPSIYQQATRNTTQHLEIDGFENFKRNQYRFNLYNPANHGIGNTGGGTYQFDFSSEFHIYAVEWSPEFVKYYVDNQLVKQVSSTNIVDKPMFVYLSLYVNTWGGDSSPTYPAEFEIDYFRAYQKPEWADTTIHQAESLSTTLSSGVTKQTWNDGASGGGWVKVLSQAVGDYVEFTANVPSSGQYQVITGYRSGSTRGTAQLSINGTNHGSPIDMYASSATFKEQAVTVNFGSSGNKQFRYRVTGKNSSSSNYELGIDYIKLVKVNPEVLHQAENLTTVLSSGVTKQTWNDGASGGGWVKVLSTAVGDYVEFTANVPSSGQYQVVTGYRSGPTRGTAQLSINGTNHGSTIDMYASSATFKEQAVTVNFGSAGNKQFRYQVTGKNSSSSNYDLGIDYIKLIKL